MEGDRLSAKEKAGCIDLLQSIPVDDIIQIAETVTNRQIAFNRIQEAIKAIITYTNEPISLLKRKKMKREYLFQYLHNQGLQVQPNDEKYVLCQRILQHWGSRAVSIGDEQKINGGPGQGDQSQVNENSFAFAKQFAAWFYQMLNSYHANCAEKPREEFGTQHFYDGVQFDLMCRTPALQTEKFVGAEIVSQRFLAFVKDEGLSFSPNTDFGGVRGTVEAHGLFVVMICGTVHMNGQVMGIFEQQFGLAQDALMQNNWRIKFTKLKLDSEQKQTPTLEGTSRTLAIN